MFTLTSAKNVLSVYYPSREFYSYYEPLAAAPHEIFWLNVGNAALRLQTINISGLMKILLYDEFLPRRSPGQNYYYN